MKYKEYNDSELISYIKEQNEEANEIMYIKYKPLIVGMAKRFYKNSNGLDLNDLINEGMLGVFNAILTYKEKLNIPFYSYVAKCIEYNLLSLVRKSDSYKNKALNDAISYDNTNDNYNIENIIGSNNNPLFNLVNNEDMDEVKKHMKDILTSLEYKVFKYRLEGLNIDEIAHILNKNKKNINNALYRIKKKIKENIKGITI